MEIDQDAGPLPWGKLDRSFGDRATAPRLSLVAHCIDVAAVTRALLELPTWCSRFEALAGHALTPTDLDRLTVLAFWHDVGKAGAGFYAKGLSESARGEWHRRCRADESQGGHTRVVAPLLGTDEQFAAHREALGIEVLWDWAGDDPAVRASLVDLWLASVSHHGEPLAAEQLSQAHVFSTWLCPVAGYDPVSGLRQLGRAARRLWPAAFDAGYRSREPAQGLIHAFAGLVSLADWIGSNAEDDRFFPYNLGPQGLRRWPLALARAKEVLVRMRIDVEDIRADLRTRQPTFESAFGFPASDIQTAAAQQTDDRLTVLEAETGSGKTEAALWRFKTLFEAGEVDGLCLLLPTRVAATGIHQRLEQFVERLFPDRTLRPNTVLAVPGYLRANADDGTRLAPFRVLWGDEPDRSPLYWAAEHSKRYFAAAAAVGTVDQFLLSSLQTRHAHLRATALLRSLVVVDEVHASDRYMRVLLAMALKRHLLAGGHAMLLSATLTSDLRDELLRPQASARATRRRMPAGPGPGADSTRADPLDDYPRISWPVRAPWIGKIAANKLIRHRIEPWMLDPDAVAALAASAVSAGARVLVLRNTVGQAVATQRALEALLGIDHPGLFRCGGVASLHHGRYALPDRQALDGRVGALYGKQAAAMQAPCVLCATQTVEISVDCDADLLITDLAPMDVLLQRMGRLHRHRLRDAHRPEPFREARCVVLTPGQHDLSALLPPGRGRGMGLGRRSAYPDLLSLQATLLALEDRGAFPALEIPRHNRALVERSCSARALEALAQQLGGPWPEHLIELKGQRSAQGGQAQMAAIDWSRPWSEAAAGELGLDARTRLGLDGIEIELPRPWPVSAFGHPIERLSLPAWMLPARAEAVGPPAVDTLHAEAGVLQFTVSGRDFVYDRFGLTLAP